MKDAVVRRYKIFLILISLYFFAWVVSLILNYFRFIKTCPFWDGLFFIVFASFFFINVFYIILKIRFNGMKGLKDSEVISSIVIFLSTFAISYFDPLQLFSSMYG